jgi:uncharacterized membrane protein YeaQ/YmgE (transglycosylase-associated protein family)
MDVNIFIVIIAGVVIGFLARLLMPGKDPIGFAVTALIGIVGVLIGTYLWDEVLFKDSDNEGIAILAGLVVAVALLWVYRGVTYGRGRG